MDINIPVIAYLSQIRFLELVEGALRKNVLKGAHPVAKVAVVYARISGLQNSLSYFLERTHLNKLGCIHDTTYVC